MESSIVALVLPPLLLIPAMGLLSRIRTHRAIGEELKRKALHVGTGLVALSFPLLFTSPAMVCAGLGIVLAWMVAVREILPLRQRFGGCLHDAKRNSYGEIYFALALAALLLLTPGRPLLYIVPLLILTLADSAAAVVGRLFPAGPLAGIAAGKTKTGSVTFFVVAALVTHSALIAFSDVDPIRVVVIALCVAAMTCFAEAVSKRGLDNIFIPAAAYSMLLILDVS